MFLRTAVSMVSKSQLEFGNRVREFRLAACRSQEEFAALANIDRSTYGKLERGLINPSLLTLSRVAVALGLTLSALLEGVTLDADEIRALPRSTRGPDPLGGRESCGEPGGEG